MKVVKKINTKIFRSDVQQIRAIAVIAVVLFHSFPSAYRYGYLGVDVFFFLSGFLIFPQIYDAVKPESKNIIKANIKKFISRRIYRIAPGLGFCIVFTWVFFFFFGPTPNKFAGADFFISIFTLFGLGNIAALNYSSDYFNFESPFTHFWSIGVELQSYLLFAILALCFSGIIRKNQKNFRIFLIFLVLFSLMSKYFFKYNSHFFTMLGLDTLAITGDFSDFYLTSNRIWEFALGGLFSTFNIKHSRSKQVNRFLPILLVFIIAFVLFFTIIDINNFRTIIVLISIGIFLSTTLDKNLKYLSHVLVWIGDRSYSIYLYHLPIFYIGYSDYIPDRLKYFAFISSLLLLLVISDLSYKYLEKVNRSSDMLSNKNRAIYLRHKKLLLVSYVIPISIISLTITLNNKLPANNNFSINFQDNYAASNLSKCPLGQIMDPCMLGDERTDKSWLLLGDSHAGALQGVLSEVAIDFQSSLTVWNKCRFFDPEISIELNALFPEWCIDSNNKRIAYIRKSNPDIIFIAYQNSSVSNGSSKMSQKLWQNVFMKTLLSINTSPNKVILFSQIPRFNNSPETKYRYGFSPAKNINLDQIPNLQTQQSFESKLSDIGVSIIDLTPVLCDKIACTRFIDNWLYIDSNHLSNFGANLVKPKIKNYLSKIMVLVK